MRVNMLLPDPSKFTAVKMTRPTLHTMFASVNILLVTTSKQSYHHGDLRNALVRAGAELAELGGPDAVTIRAAARSVGVTPTAAYRHFADHAELLEAVRQQAMVRLSASMRRFCGAGRPGTDPVTAARRQLTATGLGYVQFAVREPGLFRTAFVANSKAEPPDPSANDPFGMLWQALDELVRVGYLAPEDRPLAELAAWSAVHGISLLLIDGPLRQLSRRERDAVIERTVQMVLRGLGTGPAARGPAGKRRPRR
jgi:AcrR family transcriptional regulator